MCLVFLGGGHQLSHDMLQNGYRTPFFFGVKLSAKEGWYLTFLGVLWCSFLRKVKSAVSTFLNLQEKGWICEICSSPQKICILSKLRQKWCKLHQSRCKKWCKLHHFLHQISPPPRHRPHPPPWEFQDPELLSAYFGAGAHGHWGHSRDFFCALKLLKSRSETIWFHGPWNLPRIFSEISCGHFPGNSS